MMYQNENEKPNLDWDGGLDSISISFHAQKSAFTCERDS